MKKILFLFAAITFFGQVLYSGDRDQVPQVSIFDTSHFDDYLQLLDRGPFALYSEMASARFRGDWESVRSYASILYSLGTVDGYRYASLGYHWLEDDEMRDESMHREQGLQREEASQRDVQPDEYRR